MTLPVALPLVGGANPWAVFGPVTALSAAAGWLVAEIDRHLPVKAAIDTITRPVERVLPKAA